MKTVVRDHGGHTSVLVGGIVALTASLAWFDCDR